MLQEHRGEIKSALHAAFGSLTRPRLALIVTQTSSVDGYGSCRREDVVP